MTVYFIQAGNNGPIKIGLATDTQARRKSLQTAHHVELKVLREIEGDSATENWLHAVFAAKHLRGEWFEFDPEMMTISPPPRPMASNPIAASAERPSPPKGMIWVYETPDELEKVARAAGFSMREVCAKAGLAHTTWYRWKNAHTQPTYENRLKLGRAIEDLQSQARAIGAAVLRLRDRDAQ